MKKFILKILLLINIVAVIALLLSYLTPMVSPVKFWTIAFLGLAYPYILFINILFVIFWLLIKWRFLFFSLVAILLGWSFLSKIYQYKPRTSDHVDIKVFSYNVRNFYGKDGNGKRQENAKNIMALIEKEDADIICLQETQLQRTNIFNLSKTVERLKNVKHYQFARSSVSHGSVTMTRYPIVKMGEIRFKNSNNIAIFTDVLIKTDTVRIYNLHLQSYRINPKDYNTLESMDINDENNRKVYRKVAGSMKRAFIQRANQVKKIRERIDQCKYPVIVCGDFNDTPNSYAYAVVAKDLKDAFEESGKGLAHTYVGELPSFRIDYILYDSLFSSYNYNSPNVSYSDHLPIVCGLKCVDAE